LLKSNGEEARQKQNKEAIGDVVDVQDVPDHAVVEDATNTPTEKPLQDATEKNTTPSWEPGMYCRGIFKEDGIEYEGLVKSIESTEDGQYAVVEFIGYGNQECIWLQDLLLSNGEKSRQKQKTEANGEVLVNGQDVPDTQITAVVENKQNKEAPKDDNNNKKMVQNGNNILENKEWQVDDYCRAICDFDGQEHELQIIKQNPTNKEVFRVVVLGYGHKEIKNCNVLQQSRGENARKIQINAATQPQDEKVTEETSVSAVVSPNGSSPNTTLSSDRVTVIENGDDNNNISSKVKIPDAAGDGVNWKEKFEIQQGQLDEMSKVNDHLMIALDKMEKEMFGYVRIIQELKNSFKACVSDCSTAQRALVNGCR